MPDFFTGAAFLIVFLGATFLGATFLGATFLTVFLGAGAAFLGAPNPFFAGAAFLGAGAAFLKSALTWRVAIFVRKVGVGRESLCVRE